MISLELDFGYLNSYYHISIKALEQYRNKTLTEIMQIEAAKGNERAAKFLMKITSDPDELSKVLQLMNPENRYLILSNMNQQDLMEIMQYLDPEEMILGLSIFTREALLDMMMLLDPESLATVVLEKMDTEKFLSTLPEKYLDEFMESNKINRGMFVEALHDVDENQLQKMMEHISGESCYDNKDNIINQISSMSDDKMMEALHSFEPDGKRQLILGLLNNKPDLFEEFSPEAMTHPFKSMDKDEILKSLTVLETKDMLPMVEDMPEEILALIATQIDPNVFAKLLCADFADVIKNCGIKV